MIDDDGFGEDEVASAPTPVLHGHAARRAHQCRACDSLAEFDVWLHVRYGVRLVAIESLKIPMRVCGKHRRYAYDCTLTDLNKSIMSRELAKIGRLGIDWPNAMMEFVPCGEISWGPGGMVELQAGTA